jgi:hypothetical protein
MNQVRPARRIGILRVSPCLQEAIPYPPQIFTRQIISRPQFHFALVSSGAREAIVRFNEMRAKARISFHQADQAAYHSIAGNA